MILGNGDNLGHDVLDLGAYAASDVMFAALAVLSVTALLIYFSVDYLLDKIIYWEPSKGI